MSKSVVFSIRLDDRVKERLSEEAKKDGRTMNNLIVKILTDWLSTRKD